MDAVFLTPGAGILVLLIGSVAGSVLVCGLVLLWEAAKAAWNLVVGLLPGAARGPLFASVGTVLTRLALLFGTSIFMGLVLLLVEALLESGDSTPKVFLVVDAVLVAAVIAWWRQHRKMNAAGERIAAALASRPGASPVRLPGPNTGPSVGSVASQGLRAAQLMATRRAANAAGGIQSTTNQMLVVNAGGGRVPPPPGRRPATPGRQLPPGGGYPPGRPRGGPGGPGGGGGSGGRGRRLVGAAGTAGLLVASGGTSQVVRAAKVAHRANTVRRAARAAVQDSRSRAVRPAPVDAPAGQVVPGQVVPGRVVAGTSIAADGRMVLHPARTGRPGGGL